MKKICKVCGKEFETENSKKCYCTFACRQEGMRRYAREYAKSYQNICKNCGKYFRAGRGTSYCSPECKEAALGRSVDVKPAASAPKKKSHAKSAKPQTLSQVAKLARDAGMTYGEYVQKKEVMGW